MSKAPLLILALQKTSSSNRYKALIWILTFLVYMSYHLSRKPITVVKNALHKKCTINPGVSVNNSTLLNITNSCLDNSSWIPFDDFHPYEGYFGALDVSYLAAYAVGMFISGHIAERMNLRYFLAAGMTLSGIMTLMFGLGHSWGIHTIGFYIAVQIICGLFQSTGWPGVVAVMGNWFGKGKRGLIMGIWNSHTSLGNILGGLIASAFLTTYWEDKGYWMWSFFYPAMIIITLAALVFFLLVPHPEDVGLPSANDGENKAISESSDREDSPLMTNEIPHPGYNSTGVQPTSLGENARTSIDYSHVSFEEAKAVSFIGALKVPGVIEFSLCLFFAKLVSYTFLYWLPQYIKQVMTEYVDMKDPDTYAGDLATIVDLGGIFGAIAAGLAADLSRSSALTCAVMLILSLPSMFLYRQYGAYSYSNAVGLLLLTGFMTNGPYCLITTSVSADLGTHPSLSKNAKALATVTAIIDGTGSIGAALGPGLTAIIEGINKPLDYRMDIVFGMLIGSNLLALLLLSRLIFKEIKALRNRRTRGIVS